MATLRHLLISSKAVSYTNLINQSKAVVIMLVSVIVIPLIILLAGFTVFIRRRNK